MDTTGIGVQIALFAFGAAAGFCILAAGLAVMLKRLDTALEGDARGGAAGAPGDEEMAAMSAAVYQHVRSRK